MAVAITVNAQSKYEEPGNLCVRWNFPGLIDPFGNNLTLGAEYRILPKWSVMADAGWVFTQAAYKENKTSGYLVRPAVRFYPRVNKFWFFETQLHYKHLRRKGYNWVSHDQQNGVAAYERYEAIRQSANSYSINLLCGTQLPLRKPGRDRKDFYRWKIEYYWGLGIHTYRATEPVVVTDNSFGRMSDTFNFPRESHTTATPQFGITIVYRLLDNSLRKKKTEMP